MMLRCFLLILLISPVIASNSLADAATAANSHVQAANLATSSHHATNHLALTAATDTEAVEPTSLGAIALTPSPQRYFRQRRRSKEKDQHYPQQVLKHNDADMQNHRQLQEALDDETIIAILAGVVMLLLFCMIWSCLCSCCCRRRQYYNDPYYGYNNYGGRGRGGGGCLCDLLALLCLWEICCPQNDCGPACAILPEPIC